MIARASLAGLVSAVLLIGCGDADSGDRSTPEPAPSPPPRETVDQLPKLPDGWHPYVNRAGGFAVGLPPGWRAKSRGAHALIRSYDHLAAISILADRRASALKAPVGEFATRTADALPSYPEGLRHVRNRRFDHRYNGAEVRARATARGGIDQKLSVVVLRRDSVATVTAVIAANAKQAAQPSQRLARRVLATLRTRPPRA